MSMSIRSNLFLLLMLFLVSVLEAGVSLPVMFQDDMVIQRDEPVVIWGDSAVGEKIEVSLRSAKVKTVADSDGNWQVELPAMKAGGPYVLTVKGSKNSIKLSDVHLGDVWVLSGQSNAFVHFNYFFGQSIEQKYIDRFKKDVKNCEEEKLIRNYLVACKNGSKEYVRSESENRWFACNPKDIAEASPIAYYFAREVSKKTSVMTAVVRISWGGNVIERFYKGANNYEHMLKPWSRFKIKGVIWYQGESNIIAGDGLGYALKQQIMIRDLRSLWGNPQLPFLIVQMPPAIYSTRPFLNENSLSYFQEAQRQTLEIPFTSMAVASDLGMANGLHQPQKYELAERLVNLAFTNVYGYKGALPAGPQFKDIEVRDGKVVVLFDTFGSKLKTNDGQPPKFFGIRAKGGKEFVDAEARINGNNVIVWNDSIKKPYDVRFGFGESVLMDMNLTNSEGVPAAVFWLRAARQMHPGILIEMKERVK